MPSKANLFLNCVCWAHRMQGEEARYASTHGNFLTVAC